MAKAGDKKRIEENEAHLKAMRLLIFGTNVAYILIRLVLRSATATRGLYAGFALTSAIYAASFTFISKALCPTYGPGGEVIFAGQDRSIGGVLSYFDDIVYVTLFVQLLGLWTDKAWYAFLAIPAYAGYALAIHVVLPWWNTPTFKEAPETEADRKRREKKDRQEARAAKFGGRR